MIRPTSLAAGIAPYAPAELKFETDGDPSLLAQNESPLPPSPKAWAAGEAALAGERLYPDGDALALRRAIAAVHGQPLERIFCGAGSMELIAATIRAFAGPGDRVLATQYAYAFIKVATAAAGANYAAVPERAYTVDIDALMAGVDAATRIVFLVNPGNPTGTRIPNSEVRRLRAGLPDDVLLVIDEAYGEFDDDPAERAHDLAARGDTVILRTFSKVYGLAGARVGWGLAVPEVAAEIGKFLLPNGLTGVSQAMAAAAMADQAYMARARDETVALRDTFAAWVRALGLTVPESATNFVLVDFGSTEAAQAADRALRRAGILLRGMGGYGLPHCLRATVGGTADMDAVTAVLSRQFGTGPAE
jgi:histidinol-phosphate aminotransferase